MGAHLRAGGSATNKKDEDDVYDIEAAVLTGGGGGGFKPLQGVLRGAVFPLNSRLAVAAARRVDRLAVAVDQRPVLRGILLIYFALLHVLMFIF